MHFVSALDDEPRLKPVLCLFEGVATGAADGYARMTGRPAATLLHLGPGLANGLANVHNALKAGSAMVNIIGDHTTFHKAYDAPLNSDVEGTAAPYSHWVRTSKSLETLAVDASEAIQTSMAKNGQIATLVLPADLAWSETAQPIKKVSKASSEKVTTVAIKAASTQLTNGRKTGIILGGRGLYGTGLLEAGRIAAATGATLFAPYASARIERGIDLPHIVRIPFPIDAAVALLAPYEQLLMIGANEPVAFFAYPGKPSRIVPESADLFQVASPSVDIVDALSCICTQIEAASERNDVAFAPLPTIPSSPITPESLAHAVAQSICEGTILVDEGVTSSRGIFDASLSAPRHDLLVNVGGSIGAGLPLALGAAFACPDRPVLCISGDGSACYTLQALWSMAQQNLNVTVIICANRDYSILKGEMVRVGAMTPAAPPHPLLELNGPTLDWTALAKGFGVKAVKCDDAAKLAQEIRSAMFAPRPILIEAIMP